MTKDEQDIDIRISNLTQRNNKILKEIDNFNPTIDNPERLDTLLREVVLLKEELEDISNDVEVLDFLINGPGYNKNKNI